MIFPASAISTSAGLEKAVFSVLISDETFCSTHAEFVKIRKIDIKIVVINALFIVVSPFLERRQPCLHRLREQSKKAEH